MLIFSNDQFEVMNTIWQADQLLGEIPELLDYLKKQHNKLYEELGEEENRENASLRIKDAVRYGYQELEHIKHQLDMQYQNRAVIFTETAYQTLYQARCLTPEDRNSAIAELLLIQRYSSSPHPYMQASSLYQFSTNDALENYIAVEMQADYPEKSPYKNNIHLIRHSRIYKLLRQHLPNTDEWQHANSHWKESMIQITSNTYHREIQLHPNPESNLDYSFNEEELPQLKVLIPDSLEPDEQMKLGDLINAWALQLYPIQKMKDEFEKEKDNV